MESYDYPDFADAIGWTLALVPILIIPVWFVGYFCCNGGAKVTRIVCVVYFLCVVYFFV